MTKQKGNLKECKFALRDYVLLKQKKSNKWSTAFEQAFYIITKIHGSSLTIRRIRDRRELCWDASQLKHANPLVGAHKEYSVKPGNGEHEESIGHRTTDDEISDNETEHVESVGNQDIDQDAAVRPRRQRQPPARLADYILT